MHEKVRGFLLLITENDGMQAKQPQIKKIAGDEALEAAADQWFQLLLETFQYNQPINKPTKMEATCQSQ